MGTTAEADYEEIWAERWGDMQRFGPVSRHQRRILGTLLRGLGAQSALDVGCGEGSTLALLGALGFDRLAGIDVSATAVGRARRICPRAELTVGVLAPGTYSDGFELVTSVDVVEHVDDDVGLLRAMAAASARWVLVGTIQGRMRRGEREIGHVRNYARGELADKMRAVGITPVRIVEWGFPFYSPLFRSAVGATGSDGLAHGRYGLGRRLLCHALYALFALNAWTRGDKVFVLGTVERTADGALPTRGHAGVPAC
jgi:SAM-dependent methyltransferase